MPQALCVGIRLARRVGFPSIWSGSGQVRFHGLSNLENNEGVMRQADARGMGIVPMRPLTSGSVPSARDARLFQIHAEEVGRLLLNYVLSDPYVDAVLIGTAQSALCRGQQCQLGRHRLPVRPGRGARAAYPFSECKHPPPQSLPVRTVLRSEGSSPGS